METANGRKTEWESSILTLYKQPSSVNDELKADILSVLYAWLLEGSPRVLTGQVQGITAGQWPVNQR